MPRKNFTINDDTQLELIRLETERENQGEVLRDAITFYHYVLKRIKAGEKIFMGSSRNLAEKLNVKQLEVARKHKRKSHLKSVP